MPIRKTNLSYDLDSCLVSFEQVQNRLRADMWKTSNDGSTQTCLQKSNKIDGWGDPSDHPYIDGSGSFRNTNKIESDYDILLEIYQGTIFERIIRDVNGVRSRLMTKREHTTYSVHKDQIPRYHLALITNPNAYFIFPTLNQIMHIPADGCLYEVDTTIPHSFVNCGPDRTHLVISKGAHHD